jgi:hypothetical protein
MGPVGEETPEERGFGRTDVLAMLARYGDRAVEDVGEELGSLELTWLVAQVEQRYGLLLDLTDEVFAEMSTVTGAVRVLAAMVPPDGAAAVPVAAPPGVEAGHG